MEGPAGAPCQLRPASLDALPDAAFELVAAELGPDDLCSLRAACCAGHTAVDMHCVTAISVPLLPGEARPVGLPSLVQRCPNASTLRFITYKGVSPRLAWEHEQAVAELQRCLNQTPQALLVCAAARDARLRLGGAPEAGGTTKGKATERVCAAAPEASASMLPPSRQPALPPLSTAGAPSWLRICRIVDCPAACVEPLARLCPNAEAFSICASATGGVSRAAFQALGRLGALTQLGIAGPRRAYGGSNPLRVALDKGVWGMIASMPRLRSLTLDCRPPGWDVGHMASLPPTLTELRLRGGIEACASLRSATAVTGLVCLELGDGKLVRRDGLPMLHNTNLAALTSLELGLECVFGLHGLFDQLGPRHWLAPMTALVRLSLPCAELKDADLEAIAATAPQLTSLRAMRLRAMSHLDAMLPQLVDLAARLEEGFALDFGEFAPALRVLELEGSYIVGARDNCGDISDYDDLYGWDDQLLANAEKPLRIVLTAPLERVTGAFHMLSNALLAGVDLRVPLDAAWAPNGKGNEEDRGECLILKGMFSSFCRVLDDALRFEERELSLRAQGSMLAFVLLAAAHAPRIGALRLEFLSMCGPPDEDSNPAHPCAERDQQVEECIAAAMCLRQLSSLELIFAPWGPAAGHAMTDAHLELIALTRPKSLTRVVLRNARHVTPACAAVVMRRSREEGRAPLEVTLTYGDVAP